MPTGPNSLGTQEKGPPFQLEFSSLQHLPLTLDRGVWYRPHHFIPRANETCYSFMCSCFKHVCDPCPERWNCSPKYWNLKCKGICSCLGEVLAIGNFPSGDGGECIPSCLVIPSLLSGAAGGIRSVFISILDEGPLGRILTFFILVLPPQDQLSPWALPFPPLWPHSMTSASPSSLLCSPPVPHPPTWLLPWAPPPPPLQVQALSSPWVVHPPGKGEEGPGPDLHSGCLDGLRSLFEGPSCPYPGALISFQAPVTARPSPATPSGDPSMEEHLAVMYERLRREVSQIRSDLHPQWERMQVTLGSKGLVN